MRIRLVLLVIVLFFSSILLIAHPAKATDGQGFFIGLSGRVDDVEWQAGLDDVISVMDDNDLNLYRLGFTPAWRPIGPDDHPWDNGTSVQYFSNHTPTSYKIIVDINHLAPWNETVNHTMKSEDAREHWVDVIDSIMKVLDAFPNNPRVMVELINEYTLDDFYDKMQQLVNEIRADGYTNGIVFNKWYTRSWNNSIVDPLNKTYQGRHYYFNRISLNSAINDINTARNLGIPLINTEVGAHDYERLYFNESNVQATSDFFEYCYSHNVSNCLWVDVDIVNWDDYEFWNFEWPQFRQNDANSHRDAGENFNVTTPVSCDIYYDCALYQSHPRDLEDYYRIYLEQGHVIQISVTPPAGVNFDLELYNPSRVLKANSTNGPGQMDQISFEIDSNGNWYIRVIATSGGGNYTLFLTDVGGGGCPFVYVWNGNQFAIDNNILSASELSNGTDVEDYYKLEQTVVPIYILNGTSYYTLKLGEFENEHSYVDNVMLTAVDHDSDLKIAVTSQGEILAYQNPQSPLTCTDNNGYDRLSEIQYEDGNTSDPATFFFGSENEWLVLNFGELNGSIANLILRDDWKCDDVCIEVQVPDGGSGWQTVEVLHPRDYWGMEAVNMTVFLPAEGDFIVRLLWTAPHRLDYVGLDTADSEDYAATTAQLVSAFHSVEGNVLSELNSSDDSYAELVPGQQILLAFSLPNTEPDKTRTFIFYSEGHYFTIE
jgi:hypothetical protein